MLREGRVKWQYTFRKILCSSSSYLEIETTTAFQASSIVITPPVLPKQHRKNKKDPHD